MGYRPARWAIAHTDEIVDAVERDDSLGFCVACDAEAYCVEPDARAYECECCGARAVYGADELLIYATC